MGKFSEVRGKNPIFLNTALFASHAIPIMIRSKSSKRSVKPLFNVRDPISGESSMLKMSMYNAMRGLMKLKANRANAIMVPVTSMMFWDVRTNAIPMQSKKRPAMRTA
jgi:hypothetical protein